MFEGYAEDSGHLAVQEVYPITSEGRLVATIKRRRAYERAVVRSQLSLPMIWWKTSHQLLFHVIENMLSE